MKGLSQRFLRGLFLVVLQIGLWPFVGVSFAEVPMFRNQAFLIFPTSENSPTLNTVVVEWDGTGEEGTFREMCSNADDASHDMALLKLAKPGRNSLGEGVSLHILIKCQSSLGSVIPDDPEGEDCMRHVTGASIMFNLDEWGKFLAGQIVNMTLNWNIRGQNKPLQKQYHLQMVSAEELFSLEFNLCH